MVPSGNRCTGGAVFIFHIFRPFLYQKLPQHCLSSPQPITCHPLLATIGPTTNNATIPQFTHLSYVPSSFPRELSASQRRSVTIRHIAGQSDPELLAAKHQPQPLTSPSNLHVKDLRFVYTGYGPSLNSKLCQPSRAPEGWFNWTRSSSVLCSTL